MNYFFPTFIVLLVAFRFFFLEQAPAGFFVDEAHGALALACISDHLTDVKGQTVGLYTDSLNGGNWGPVFLFIGGLWAKIFGTTIFSMRLMQALVSLITIYFIYQTALALKSKQAGIWAVIAGLISPWSIQLGRMHWEANFLPMFLAAGTYLVISGYKSRCRMSAAGISFALAAYSYPAGRLHAPLVMIFLAVFLLVNKRLRISPWLYLCASAFIFILPLGYLIIEGDLMGRGNIVGIYTEHYLARIGKEQTLTSIIPIFFDNFSKHLSIDFLMISGDRILRHHSGFGGQLSWLSSAAFLLYPVSLIWRVFRKKDLQVSKEWEFTPLFIFLCFAACFVPASFTWDSIPHALRSIPGWVFAALFTGLITSWLIANYRFISYLFAGLSVIYFSLYTYDYLYHYPDRSAAWFDIGDNIEGERRAEANDWKGAISKYRLNPHENYLTHMRYWMTAYGGYSCRESGVLFDVWQRQEGSGR